LLQKLLPPQPIFGFAPFFLTDPSSLLFEVPGALTFLINYGSGKSGGMPQKILRGWLKLPSKLGWFASETHRRFFCFSNQST
jgi:hypothetical protein